MENAQQKERPNLGLQEFNATSGGATVQKMDRFGSLAKAGVQVGDELVSIGGHDLAGADTAKVMDECCDRNVVGSTIQVRLRRNGQEQDVPVQLMAKKAMQLDIDEESEVLERKIAP